RGADPQPHGGAHGLVRADHRRHRPGVLELLEHPDLTRSSSKRPRRHRRGLFHVAGQTSLFFIAWMKARHSVPPNSMWPRCRFWVSRTAAPAVVSATSTQSCPLALL